MSGRTIIIEPSKVNGEVLTEEQEDVGGRESIPLGRRFRDLKTIASFAVAFVIMLLAFSRVNLDPATVIAHIREANLWLFLAALVVYYFSFPIRAWRWRLLLNNVGYRGSSVQLPSIAGLAEIIFLSWFANCIVPAKLGDAYRGYLLKRNSAVSFSRTMGTVLAERVIDMLVLFGLLGLTGLEMFGAYLPGPLVYLFVAGLILAAIIILALLTMKRFGRQVERRLPQRVQSVYVRFEEGTLQSFRNLPLLLVLSLAVWAIEAGRLWLVLWALGLTGVGVSTVLFTSLAASLLTTLPITPAGLGLVESGVIGVLLLMNSTGVVSGITENLAGSVAILDRSISYWSLVVFGTLTYIATKKK